MNQEKIGKFIAQLRKNKQLTQEELASKLGVTNRSISKWENGRGMPDLSLFKPLCDELGITINDLLSGEKVDKDIYQNKLEENMIKIIYSSIKNKGKYLTKLLLKISLILIILFIILLFINEYIQRPIYLKEQDINFYVCDYNEKYIALSAIVKDDYSAYININKKDATSYTIKLYRKWIETKKLSLLDNNSNGIYLFEKNIKQIYYDNKIIWNNNMNISICNLG